MEKCKSGQIWNDYSNNGRSIAEISRIHSLTMLEVRRLLRATPGYKELAVRKRRSGLDRFRESVQVVLDTNVVMLLLQQGVSERAVARQMEISRRTLRDKLKELPAYRVLQEGRKALSK